MSASLRTLSLVAALLAGGTAAAKDPEGFACPKVDKKATAQQVFDARMAAMAAGNMDLAFCYYAEDAEVILPGTVVKGREAIQAAFLAFGSAFGGKLPDLLAVTATEDVVLVNFTVVGPAFSVLDGADTFVIRDGLIRTQTVHAPIVPSST